MVTAETRSMGRAPFAGALRRFRGHLSEARFWVVQSLVLLVTLGHGVAEYAQENGGSIAFFEALQQLPVEAYVLPVVLAGWWYGLEGGLFTGLLATALSVPNLVLFHASDFAWAGELAASVFIVSVGVLVAYMVDREARFRENAETTSRRLEMLHAVTSVLNRHNDPDAAITAVVSSLDGVEGIRAAAFVPADGALPGGVVLAGNGSARGRLSVFLEGEVGDEPHRVLLDRGFARVEVATGQRTYGSLVVDCGGRVPCPDDSGVLTHVAHELAFAVENALMRQREREHLQRYARAVTVAQENERKRIARDLHDGPAQSLVVLSRGLGRLAQTGGESSSGGETAWQLQEVARDTLRSIRRTTWALRPALLDDLGLLPALESLAEHQPEPGSAAVAVGVVGEPRRLDRDVELAAFRIVQEALANVAHHASAENAAVTIAFLEDRVALTVADDGIGFDVAAQEGHDHFGLTGMRERTELVGGTLSVISNAGVGTVVHFEAPG